MAVTLDRTYAGDIDADAPSRAGCTASRGVESASFIGPLMATERWPDAERRYQPELSALVMKVYQYSGGSWRWFCGVGGDSQPGPLVW